MLFCSAACFRIRQAISWSDIKSHMIDSWVSGGLGYRPNTGTGWRVDEGQIKPELNRTIARSGNPRTGLFRLWVLQ